MEWYEPNSFKTDVIEISEDFQPKKQEARVQTSESKPKYYKSIPILTTKKKINAKNYLTGEISCSIYNKIDGNKSINEISQELKVTQEQVYDIISTPYELQAIIMKKRLSINKPYFI